MTAPYRQLNVQPSGTACCLALRNPRLDFAGLDELLADLDTFMAAPPSVRCVFVLGPEEPECLYSMLLAKLVSLQKRLRAAGGDLKLAGASDNVKQIFAACRLLDLFDFQPDRDAALAALGH
jgi:hypothetical protein